MPTAGVARFIAWWIDGATGLPIPDRAGRVRWFARLGDTLHWADTRDELLAAHGAAAMPKSATFIPATLADNAILMAADPGYRANLMALSMVERLRLMEGQLEDPPCRRAAVPALVVRDGRRGARHSDGGTLLGPRGDRGGRGAATPTGRSG